MLRFSSTDYVDTDLHEQRINHNGKIWINRDKLLLIQQYLATRQSTMNRLATESLMAGSSHGFYTMDKVAVHSYLKNYCNVESSQFKVKGVQGTSLNTDMVLKPIMENGKAQEFLGPYIAYSSSKSVANRLRGELERLVAADTVDRDDTPLHFLTYIASIQPNLRFNYNNSDVISIPREAIPSFTVPKGKLLVWGDYAQSDWRIAYSLFIKDEHNWKIMQQYKDAYEGLYAMIADFYGQEHDHEQFLAERDLYKVNVLQTIYGQRSSRVARDNKVIQRIAKFLESCPRYMEYNRRIRENVKLGLMLPVVSYFNFEQTTSGAVLKAAIDKCLNTPIQTGTSEVVILTCNAIMDKFLKLGYTSDDISLYIVRHDEPIFMLSEKVMKDAWVFEEASKIIVDNWMPLELKFSFGNYYKEVNPLYEQWFQDSVNSNADKLSYFEATSSPVEYWPMKDVANIYFVKEEIKGELGEATILLAYNGKDHTYHLVDFPSVDPEVVNREAHILVQKITATMDSNEYRGLLVYSNFLRGDIYIDADSMYVNFTNIADKFHSIAQIMGNRAGYSKAKELQDNNYVYYEAELLANIEAIRSVGEMRVLQAQNQ